MPFLKIGYPWNLNSSLIGVRIWSWCKETLWGDVWIEPTLSSFHVMCCFCRSDVSSIWIQALLSSWMARPPISCVLLQAYISTQVKSSASDTPAEGGILDMCNNTRPLKLEIWNLPFSSFEKSKRNVETWLLVPEENKKFANKIAKNLPNLFYIVQRREGEIEKKFSSFEKRNF